MDVSASGVEPSSFGRQLLPYLFFFSSFFFFTLIHFGCPYFLPYLLMLPSVLWTISLCKLFLISFQIISFFTVKLFQSALKFLKALHLQWMTLPLQSHCCSLAQCQLLWLSFPPYQMYSVQGNSNLIHPFFRSHKQIFILLSFLSRSQDRLSSFHLIPHPIQLQDSFQWVGGHMLYHQPHTICVSWLCFTFQKVFCPPALIKKNLCNVLTFYLLLQYSST